MSSARIEEALLDIYNKRGALTPALVVKEATKASHPLHNDFEWDNTIAGQKYREVQAGHMIRMVTVVVPETGEKARKFVNVTFSTPLDVEEIGGAGTYVPAEEVALNPQMRASVERQMKLAITALERRYASQQSFWDLIDGLKRRRPRKAS